MSNQGDRRVPKHRGRVGGTNATGRGSKIRGIALQPILVRKPVTHSTRDPTIPVPIMQVPPVMTSETNAQSTHTYTRARAHAR